jgi:hypothetical protein
MDVNALAVPTGRKARAALPGSRNLLSELIFLMFLADLLTGGLDQIDIFVSSSFLYDGSVTLG